jgi:hypothetical protein
LFIALENHMFKEMGNSALARLFHGATRLAPKFQAHHWGISHWNASYGAAIAELKLLGSRKAKR